MDRLIPFYFRITKTNKTKLQQASEVMNISQAQVLNQLIDAMLDTPIPASTGENIEDAIARMLK